MEKKLSKKMRLTLTVLGELEKGAKKQEGYLFTRDIHEQIYGIYEDTIPKAVISSTSRMLKQLTFRGLVKESLRPTKGHYRPVYVLTEKGRNTAKEMKKWGI